MTYIYSFLDSISIKYTLLISLFFLMIIVLMNLGKFLDITDQPQKADIIVCLGGGYAERLEKSLQLYKHGYSKTDKIILTGSLIGRLSKENIKGINKIKYFKEHNVPEKNIVFTEDTSNTMEEVLFVKDYMLKHHYTSVIFISEPTHSRRISFLAKFVNNYDDANLSYVIVGSDVKWWNRDHYYKNKRARRVVMYEISGLIHNFITYGILQKLGIL